MEVLITEGREGGWRVEGEASTDLPQWEGETHWKCFNRKYYHVFLNYVVLYVYLQSGGLSDIKCTKLL